MSKQGIEPRPEKLCVPGKVLDQHLVVLGKTGSGKSSVLRHFVEHLLGHHKRVCIIDPKGDWYGIKVSADGRAGGFPVIAFGDFKNAKATDVPINERSGKHVAELVATGNRPCVIGFRGWMTSHMVSFWIDFASTLFAANVGELYLVVDEFHNFAPKGKILDPQAGKCLHWSNRLLSEGRGLGIVCLTASQRPQKVHNDSLTSHETLVAMRVIHKADRDAIKDWIDGNGDPALGKEVLATLASMPRGEAWVWSPEIGFGPERVKFPMFTTFDSFAPPQLLRKVSESGWADVDLNAVKEKLAEVIEEEKANDPKALKAEVARLRVELRKAQAAKPAAPVPQKVEVKRVEVPVLKDGQLDRADALVGKLMEAFTKGEERQAKLKEAVDALAAAIGKAGEPAPAAAAATSAISRRVAPAAQPSNGQHVAPAAKEARYVQRGGLPALGEIADPKSRNELPGPMRKIIDAYAFWHSVGVDKPTRENIAPLAGYSNIRSSGFRNPLYSCQTSGLVEDEQLTAKGRELAAWPEAVTSLEKYHQKLKSVMDGPTAKLFDALHAAGGASTRTDLATATGYTNERSSGFRNPLYRLSSMGLVELKKEAIEATRLMYPHGMK